VATALTAAVMVRDSSVTFSPTSFSTAGTVYTYEQPVDDKFFIYCEFTSTTNADFMTFTVSAGSTTVAWRRDLSTLAVTITSTGKTAAYRKLIGPLESSRFMGSTGTITVTTSSSTNTSGTGFIGVAHMPYVIYS
jgi:hypothetical protein